MNYLIVVFSGRSEAIAFYDKMLSFGIRADVVNTPRSLRLSCGISVRIPLQAQATAKRLIAGSNSFSGMYLITNGGNGFSRMM